MPGATSAAYARRLQEGYFKNVFVGKGLDIGCGQDPVTKTCDTYDLEHGDGDAQTVNGIPAESYDWVYSSHCLEHLNDPQAALQRWWELVRPGGKLVVVVPDENLYEQGHWPSPFNGGHQWSFRLEGEQSWSPVSIRIDQLIADLPNSKVLWVKRFDTNYNYEGGLWDRTLTDQAEAHIEAVVEKKERG